MTKLLIKNYISLEKKKELWEKAKILTYKMYDRQKDGFSSNRRKKIYLGLISEYIFFKWAKQNNYDIKKWEGKDIDDYDFIINNNIFIDIKSSKEHKPYQGNDFFNFLREKRNFTLPKDQVKQQYLDKNYYIIQIMYDYNFNYCYITNGIKLQNLIQKDNLKKLKLDNKHYQETYMKPLKYEEKTFLNLQNENLFYKPY